jgi:hypothetical protein
MPGRPQASRASEVSIRPLDKGIITALPSTQLPDGALLDAQNCYIRQEGILKRGGVVEYATSLVDYPPIVDIIVLEKTDGTQSTVVVDQKFVYELSSGSATGKYYTYTTGTFTSIVAGVVTGSGTLWNTAASDVAVDDVFVSENITTGTAQAGALGSITLAAGASGTDDIYNRMYVDLTGGTGSGQRRIITDYDGTTKVATVDTNWGTTPDNTSTYAIYIEDDIGTITNDTSITLDDTAIALGAGSYNYSIRRAFNPAANNIIDWTIVSNKIVFTDGIRTLRSWDGTTYTEYSSSIDEIVDVVEYHADRLWGGRQTNTAGGDDRHRIIWTTVLDLTDWPALFLSLPYTQGRLRRIRSMGDFLAVFMEDAVWILRPTNRGDSLPLAPVRVESGDVGIVGPRAVAQWVDGLFFVGQDDVYYLSASAALQPLNSPVRDDILANRDNLWETYAVTDPVSESILFGIPGSTGQIEKIWAFNLKSKAWSYHPILADCLSRMQINETVAWNDAVGTWNTNTYGSWNSIGAPVTDKRVYFGLEDDLRYISRSEDTDPSSASINFVMETPDYDFKVPDRDKTFLRFGFRLSSPSSSTQTFMVEVSVDGGATYKNVGNVNIDTDKSEAYVDFRATGSIGRFRVSSVASLEQFTVSEYSLRVVGRGYEIERR